MAGWEPLDIGILAVAAYVAHRLTIAGGSAKRQAA